MVSDAEIRQKIHEEKLAIKYAEIKEIQKGIKKKPKTPRVSNEYIDYLRKHNLPITQADITKGIRAPHKKLSRDADHALNMLEAQYEGIMLGFQKWLAIMMLIAFLYLIPIEWL